MKNHYLTTLATGMFLLGGIAGASAADYISVNPVANPANGYKGGPQGNVSITWPGVSLQMESQDKDAKNPVDPSFVEITLNGNPVTINPNTTGGGKVLVGAQYISDGATTQTRVDDQLLIVLPDMFFFWTGDVKINIKEGAVTSTTGEINAPISLEYTFNGLNYDVIWNPELPSNGSPVTFTQGNAIFYASWDGCTDLSINSNARPFYMKENDTDNGTQLPASDYISIEDGKVKFDFSTFGVGTYLVDLPDGAVNLGDGNQNGEAIYNFRIVESVAPQYYVSAQPSEYGYFDAFSVVWATDITQPYEISSKYASVNPDSGNLVFNQTGKSLIKVTKNGIENVGIAQVSIVEYQQSEYSKNYPNAQLLVTLYGFEMDVESRYTLTIPAGLVDIDYDGKTVANDDITFTFTLKGETAFELPAPTIDPLEGTVSTLETVNVSWPATLGGLDALNKNNGAITVTFNGEAFTDFEATIEWSAEDVKMPGADGDMLVITFGNNLEDGTYVITIPQGYVNVTDIDRGTLQNEPLVLTYGLNVDPSGIEGISAEGVKTIYNINGVKVGSELNNLPSGLYIINGTKTLIP